MQTLNETLKNQLGKVITEMTNIQDEYFNKQISGDKNSNLIYILAKLQLVKTNLQKEFTELLNNIN